MSPLKIKIREAGFWKYQILGWLAFAALYGAMYSLTYKSINARVLASLALQYAAGFLLTVVLRLYYRTTQYERHPLPSIVVMIFLCSFFVTLLWFCAIVGIEIALFGDKAIRVFSKLPVAAREVAFNFPVILSWSTLYFGIKFWRDWMGTRHKTELAEAAVQKAQFQVLRYQINPHFLFNALNSIRALVDEDARAAKTMITDLSEFLRYSLVSRKRPMVTLREEVDAVRLFLAIEQKRYEDKLLITFNISSDVDEFPVPSFFLHPLIEHALKTGMKAGKLPLELSLSAVPVRGRLRVELVYSGTMAGVKENGSGQTGLDLAAAQLQLKIPGRYNLTTTEDGGKMKTTVEFSIDAGVFDEKAAHSYYR